MPKKPESKMVALPGKVYRLLKKSAKSRDLTEEELAARIIEAYFDESSGANLALKPGQRFHCGKVPDVEVCVTRINGGWIDLVDLATGLHLTTIGGIEEWAMVVKGFDLTPIPSPKRTPKARSA